MSGITKNLRGNEYLVTYSVAPKQSGIRLDHFLMEYYRRRSREQIKRAIDSGAITIARGGSKHLNLGRIKASSALYHGDVVSVLSRRKAEPAVDFNYKILFEDDDIAVIEKPANLPVHPAGRFFFHTLLVHLKTRGFTKGLEAERKFFLVHRIDKETSGILLLAKTKEACNLLTQQFKERQTEKYYLALVKGTPREREFLIDQPMGKVPGSRIGLKMYPIPESEGGQTAQTAFKLIESRGQYSLLACYPKTGRQHQIRVHAEFAGYPLVGDKLYGLPEEDVLAILDAHREAREDLASDASPDPVEDAGTINEEEESEEKEREEEMAEPDTLASEATDTTSEERFEIPGPTSVIYAELEAKLILPRHALHAAGLTFTHPITGQRLSFNSPLPNDLQAFFDRQEKA